MNTLRRISFLVGCPRGSLIVVITSNNRLIPPSQTSGLLLLLNKNGGLAAHCHQKANSRETGEKGKVFYSDAERAGEHAPCLKAHLFRKTQTQPSYPQQTKTKGSAQRSCPILKYRPLEPKAAASDYPSSLACSQLLSGFRLLPGGGLCVELVLPLAMQLLGPQVLMAPGPETMVNTLANALPGQRERQRLPPGGHGSCDC